MNRLHPILRLTALLILLAALAACQSQPAARPAASTANAPAGQPAGTSVPATTSPSLEKSSGQTPVSGPAVTPVLPSGGPGAFNLEDPSVGLKTLASYRQSLVLEFDGTVNGEQTHSKTSLRRTVTSEPAAQITWIELDGRTQQMYATLGDISYRQAGVDGPCAAAPVTTNDPATVAFQLQSLPVLHGAEAAGEETVNTVPSHHYIFDGRALGQGEALKAKGEAWIASQGGYVVKYSLWIEAELDELGPGVTGVQTWEYQLTDPNAVTTSDLPKTCIDYQGAEVAPLPPQAAHILRLPGFLEFEAPLSAQQVARFYQDKAESLGWKATGSSQPQDVIQVLNFHTAGGGLLSIRIRPQDGGVKVSVQTAPPAPTPAQAESTQPAPDIPQLPSIPPVK